MSLSSHDTQPVRSGRAPAPHPAEPNRPSQPADTADRCLRTLGLSQNPFSMAPDTVNFYSSSQVEAIIVEVLQHVETRMGFALLCGEVGLGKTTISRRILHELDVRGIQTALVFNTFYQGAELLREINKDFGVDVAEPDLPAQMAALNEFLLDQRAQGRNCVIIIDDAQNLTAESLELVRQISNMETGTDKIVQIILVGQTELEEKLELHSLRQLKSRIALKRTFRPYTLKETETYIRTKIARSGDRFLLEISDAAIRRVHAASKGAPRRINVIMGRCLYAAVARRSMRVTRSVANLAIRDVAESFEPAGAARLRRPLVAAAVAGTLMLVPLAAYKLSHEGVLAEMSWREPVRQLAAALSSPSGGSRPDTTVNGGSSSSTDSSSPHPEPAHDAARAASVAALHLETARSAEAAAAERRDRHAPDDGAASPRPSRSGADTADTGLTDRSAADDDPGIVDGSAIAADPGIGEAVAGTDEPDVVEVSSRAADPGFAKATRRGAVRGDREEQMDTAGPQATESTAAQSAAADVPTVEAVGAREPEVDPAVREFLAAYDLARFAERFETALRSRRFDSVSRDILDSTGLRLVVLPAAVDNVNTEYDTLRIPGAGADQGEYLLFWSPRFWVDEHFSVFYSPQAIAELQTALKRFGSYQYYIDGLAGPQTTGALEDFQRAVGLPPTRVPDVATLFMLEHVNPAAGPGLAQSGAHADDFRPDAPRTGFLE